MRTLIQDLRYSARILLKKPGFTSVAIITLGLGIGANTAIFSLVNAAMLRPLPLALSDRIVEVTPLRKGAGIGGCWQRRFGGDPNLIGKKIKLNNNDFTVIGIAPEEFRGTVLFFGPEIYAPMTMAKQIDPGSNWLESRGSRTISALGRLKQGVTATQARVSLRALRFFVVLFFSRAGPLDQMRFLARKLSRCEDTRVRISHPNSAARVSKRLIRMQPLAYARGTVHPNTKEEKPDASRRQSRRGHRGRNGSWPRDRLGVGESRVLGSDQLQPVEK